MKHPIVFYHAACRDGFAAAWAASKELPKAEFREAFYGQPPADKHPASEANQ